MHAALCNRADDTQDTKEGIVNKVFCKPVRNERGHDCHMMITKSKSGAVTLSVQVRAVEQRQSIDVALSDAIDDDGDCRKHDAKEHLGVQIVHGLHSPCAHHIEPKLRASIAHALVKKVPKNAHEPKSVAAQPMSYTVTHTGWFLTGACNSNGREPEAAAAESESV